VNLRKLPVDSDVGGVPAGFFVSAGFFWTRHLVTQVEFVSQVEDWDPDYASENIVRPMGAQGFEVTTVLLKHSYVGSRWAVAQIVQIGTKKIRPYFGAGAGIEVQSIQDSRHGWSQILQPGQSPPTGAKTVDEFPTEFPPATKTRHAVAFGQAGVKIFVAQRAYLLVDWKFMHTGAAPMRLGFGLEF
jgi:hypothetical protein